MLFAEIKVTISVFILVWFGLATREVAGGSFQQLAFFILYPTEKNNQTNDTLVHLFKQFCLIIGSHEKSHFGT